MVAMPKPKTRYYTPEEYFEIDARADQRLEYVYGRDSDNGWRSLP